jgi:hypothetical protein
MIPRCRECGRVIGDYHDPDCKIRSDCGLLVTHYHCEVEDGTRSDDSSW